MSQLPKAIIVDIDGTFADCEHRWLAGTRPDGSMDWKVFSQNMEHDSVNEWCKLIVQNFYFNEYEILFVTGRMETHRELTSAWICAAMDMLLPELFEEMFYLHMRPAGDFRPDVEVKREIYERGIKGKYDVVFAVDDTASVVEMWRSEGLVCLQCAKGDF